MGSFDDFYSSLPVDPSVRGDQFEKIFVPWFLKLIRSGSHKSINCGSGTITLLNGAEIAALIWSTEIPVAKTGRSKPSVFILIEKSQRQKSTASGASLVIVEFMAEC